MVLILGLHELLEGGEGVLDHGRQHAARAGQLRAEPAGACRARGAGRLADRTPLALGRLIGQQLGGGRVPHVAAAAPFGAEGPPDLVGDLVRHAAGAGLHQPALEVGDGVTAPGLTVRTFWLAAALRLAVASGFRHLAPPTHDRTRYHCRTNGAPVARKCPTFRHSVTPTLVRRASGWGNWPQNEDLRPGCLIPS